MHARHRLGLWLALSVTAAVLPWASACGPSVDLKRDLQVVDVTSGWLDAGVVAGGKNKLVPTISFAFKNTSSHPVSSVQINLSFWRKGEEGEFDDAFVTSALGTERLNAGEVSKTFVLSGKVGYTGDPGLTRAEMLQHSQFHDATAKLFVNGGSSQWAQLGEFPIERRLIVR